MKCAEVRELLGNYMDQELTEGMMQRIEKHLLRCAACAYEARSIEQAREMLRRGVETPMVSEPLGERILRHIAEHFPHVQATREPQEPISLPPLPLEGETPAEPLPK
ncbi:MAG: zf-HC2 domain-containing protein [Armatimonadota bacterium]|nr:zf-HC2 domain-containing protein [bacterium]MDW8320164.1 zf-HC2 domain-containing protein [Armatimonadota bacterium]